MSAELIRTYRTCPNRGKDNPESGCQCHALSCPLRIVTINGGGIADAIWRYAAHALRFGAGCAIDVSKLRPRGSDNGKGLIASGPVSFLKIFSVLNEVLRRGGHL